jgi:hypothetical protein
MSGFLPYIGDIPLAGPSLCLLVAPAPCLSGVRFSNVGEDDGDVASRVIAEEIFRKDSQSVIAGRDLRGIQETLTGEASAGDVSHDISEDGQAFITRLAALCVNESDHVLTGRQVVEDEVIEGLLEALFGRAVGAQ